MICIRSSPTLMAWPQYPCRRVAQGTNERSTSDGSGSIHLLRSDVRVSHERGVSMGKKSSKKKDKKKDKKKKKK
jgi:hypothetical protein